MTINNSSLSCNDKTSDANPTSPVILVSACLLGEAVRYDGKTQRQQDPRIQSWLQKGYLLKQCPEVAGGLPIPRVPAEIQGGSGADVLAGRIVVLDKSHNDKSEAFILGARQSLALCQQYGIQLALLKSRSPSCGNDAIYDGSFNNRLVSGEGVTAALLKAHGIMVYNELEIDQLEQALDAKLSD